MQSILAAWRVSLHRTRADWPIVAAAGLIALLAATLLASGPIYSSAVAEAGLHRVLESAPTAVGGVEVDGRLAAADVAAADRTVSDVIGDAFRGTSVSVSAMGVSGSFALPGQGDDVRDLVTIGFVQGVERHATLVAGAWPDQSRDAAVTVAVLEPVADVLGLQVGDTIRLTSRTGTGQAIDVWISGMYRPTDPAEHFWWDDERLLEGVVESDQYRTFGPLLATSEAVLQLAGDGSLDLTWRAFPRIDEIGVDQISRLRARLGQLPVRIEDAVPQIGSVRSGLPEILAEADRSLLVSRTGVFVLMLQVAVLAAYALVLTAGLIADHRRLDTALLRSRGGSQLQIAALALPEALLVALPATLLAPWLAAVLLRLFNAAGPLAGIGLQITPTVSVDAYVAAGVAGVSCTALLILLAVLASRTFAAEEAGRSRGETRPIGQRIGLDLALVGLTAVGLWQLRLYGAPVTSTVQGTLGFDPLLVAAPAIGLLAGSVLALRVVPLLARAAERVAMRGRALVGSLGTRQLARRPLRYTRASLLVMLAISMGVFAVSYTTTWTASQRDQADFQAGATIRMTPDRGLATVPPWALGAAIDATGASAVMPVAREGIRLSPASDAGELIALDATTAGQVILLRPDQSGDGVGAVAAKLAEARPPIEGVPLDGTPARLLVSATVDIDGVGRVVRNETNDGYVVEPAERAPIVGRSTVTALVALRDARGLVHQFTSAPATLSGDAYRLVVPLAPGTDRARLATDAAGGGLSYPIDVIGVDLVVRLPFNTVGTSGRIAVDALETSDERDVEAWRSVALDPANGWRIGWSQGAGVDIMPVPQTLLDGRAVRFGEAAAGTAPPAFAVLPGQDRNGNGVTTSYTAADVANLQSLELQAIVNEPFLRDSGSTVGDRVFLPVAGRSRTLRIAGVVEAFPTTDPARPAAVVDLSTLALTRFASGRSSIAPTEWWVEADDAAIADVAGRLSEGPFVGARVVTAPGTRERLSSDPLALAMIGALSLGFIVAVAFAIIGLAVSAAVSARQRRTEFALLRALGLSSGQLSRWLWLENGSVVAISLLFGTALGLLIGWIALPFISVTQSAAVPFPPVVVEIPWATIALLEVICGVTLVGVLAGIGRAMRRTGMGSVLRMGEDG